MKRGKRYKDEEKINQKAMMFVSLIFFLCLFVISGIKIIKYIKNNDDNKKIMQNIEIVKANEDSIGNEEEYKIDFKG